MLDEEVVLKFTFENITKQEIISLKKQSQRIQYQILILSTKLLHALLKI